MKVPGIGEVKPVYVVGTVAAAGGVIIYAYVKNRNANAAAASVAATGPSADQIDPATGLPYSQEQGAMDTGAAFTPYGGIDPSTGIPYIDEVGNPGGVGGNPNPITTNTVWSQTAQQELENTFGYSTSTSQSAVRKYLGQKDGLTHDEASAIQTVVAEIGTPPTGGPYRIITATAPVPPSSTQVAVPNTVGKTAGTAHNLIVSAHLVPIAPPGQKATQKVKSTNPKAGTKVAPGTRILINT